MIYNHELPDFSRAKVLVFGDVMLDRYWHGDARRISPEAPVPVINVQQIIAKAGGAANVASNLKALGVDVSLCGIVGQDAQADELSSLIADQQIPAYLHRDAHRPTVTKLRVLGQSQQLLRLDFENTEVTEIDGAVMAHYRECLQQVSLVVLSDYAKGALIHASEMIAIAKAEGIPVLVDPKHTDFNVYRGATLVTPNLKEFEAVVGPCAGLDDIVARATELMKQCDIANMLVTRGKDGMLLVSQSGNTVNLPTRAREVFDVTGAGDTVIAVLAASLAAGTSIEEAVELSNAAAGLVVAKIGAETVTPTELRRALHKHQDAHLGVLTEAELMQAITDARAAGESIVMTNGCFDILHAGHVAYLQQAKSLGRRLIVAVNTDDSVRQLKGSERPFNSVNDRMDVLAALSAVDWVVPFSEQTPRRLIASVLPDILVKGGDYTVDAIAGAQEVLEAGGSVEILTFKDGRSTTSLVEKIRGE